MPSWSGGREPCSLLARCQRSGLNDTKRPAAHHHSGPERSADVDQTSVREGNSRDRATCPQCGSPLTVWRLHTDGFERRWCTQIGCMYSDTRTVHIIETR